MRKLLLLDRQLLTAQGMLYLFAGSEFSIVHSPNSQGAAIYEAVKELQPDVLMIDPFLTEESISAETLSALKTVSKSLPVIGFTNSTRSEDLSFLAAIGIRCHLSKQAAPNEIFAGLQAALNNKGYHCQRTRQLLMGEVTTHPLAEILSEREKEILLLIADGKTDREIAETIFLSFHTVRTHRKNIGRKLGFSLKNVAELSALVNSLR